MFQPPTGHCFSLQAEKQLELQLFKLYHNERDIDELQDDLDRRVQMSEREQRKREKIEDEVKEKKKELGKLSRELGKIEQQIKDSVSFNGYFLDIVEFLNIILEILFSNSFLQEVELNKKRPQFIKAKEKTAHMVKKLESAK